MHSCSESPKSLHAVFILIPHCQGRVFGPLLLIGQGTVLRVRARVHLYRLWVSSGGKLTTHHSEARLTEQEATALPFPSGGMLWQARKDQLCWRMGME